MVITRDRLPQFKRWLSRMIKHQHELIKGMQILVLSLEDAYSEIDNLNLKQDLTSTVAIKDPDIKRVEREITDLGKKLKEIEFILQKYVNEDEFEILDIFENDIVEEEEPPTANFRRKKEL